MMIRHSLALAAALAAGTASVLIGRTTVSRDVLWPQVKGPPAPSTAPLAGRECKAERAELAATKTQLANCVAGVPQPLQPDTPSAVETWEEKEAKRWRRNMEVLRQHPEDAVMVRRADYTVHYYPPNEPIPPDGLIVARRLPGGELGHYAGPDAGARSDPAAFRPLPGPRPTWGRLPDGTITIDGKPAARSVQKMFGGKYDEDAEE